jgi:hypothetical protein
MSLTIAGGYNRGVHPGTVARIGRRAAARLGACGEARVLASLGSSLYVVVRDDILWIAGRGAPLHPRGVVLSAPLAARRWDPGEALVLEPGDVAPWSPAPPTPPDAPRLRRAVATLVATAPSLGRPAGFGARLVGAALPFPLSDADAHAEALAAACRRDAAEEAAARARPLLGLGAGLTPSGDDFVGGVFFARRLLARAGACDDAAWRRAADGVRGAAREATHAISAALLADQLDGEAWEPLHDLAVALGRDDAATRAAAQRLVRLGHSSGWDLLAGFVAGIAA